MYQTVLISLLSERYVLVTWHMNKSLGYHTRKEMIKYTILSFKQKQTLRKNYFWRKMKACQHFLKLFAVFSIMAMQIAK